VLALGPVGIMAGPVLLTVLMAIQEIVRERRMQGQSAMPETHLTLEPE
jgi:predicted PurR-regulated permease PerM